MSELGNNLQRIKNQEKFKSINDEKRNNKVLIGIKTPVRKSNNPNETLFEMHTDIFNTIEDNLKNLIMTQKGERLGFPDFGTNLSQVYSDNTLSDDEKVELATQQILKTVSKYMPNITLQNFYSEKVPNVNEKENILNKNGLVLANETQNVKITSLPAKGSSHINKNNSNFPSKYQIIIGYTILNKTKSLTLFVNSAI
jgi:phage baseplate assembly protein W